MNQNRNNQNLTKTRYKDKNKQFCKKENNITFFDFFLHVNMYSTVETVLHTNVYSLYNYTLWKEKLDIVVMI